ncbi:hypothetical protein SK128_012924 [Halocaridina rubra]|uniref:DE-cadherin n=1 Tax=Halocaridina rubra TaxID=373956 RepID=A0AAN8XIN2_HALRR
MDEGGAGHDADPASVLLTILDVNDNHPYIQSPDNSYAKIMENSDPATVGPIPIQLGDLDTQINGCPCTLQFDSSTSADIISKFSVEQIDAELSLYQLKPLQKLDREQQKFYHIPFRTSDSKNFQGTRILNLEVGDMNDSPMTDGSSTIEVFNYQGQFPAMVIGSVYVSDLDDHDVGDKTFEIDPATGPETELYFTVDHDSGNITMKKGTPEGEHALVVKVIDKFRNETAYGTVKIVVTDLTEEAVMNSGSFTVNNYTALELITQQDLASTGTSMYDRLKDEIGKVHGISSSDVFIFGLDDVTEGVEVRYNCKSPNFFTAPRLNGQFLLRRQQIMQSLGIDIPMVDINKCLYESLSPCDLSSCQQYLRPNLTHPLLLTSETSTVVGVDITAEYVCSCGPLEPLPSVCYDSFCYNGGKCDKVNNTLTCICPDENDYGPRCELLNARFERGYSWYESFKVCENSSILLSFKSTESKGILMYAGPMVSRPWADYPRDFLYVVINQKILETYFDFGTGTMKIQIPLLELDKPYNLRMDWDNETITFEVPYCMGNTTVENPDCKVSQNLPGLKAKSFLLNVQGPLQLGGVAAMESFSKLANSYGWSLTPPTIDPFFGCILELRHNEYLYDLNSTDYGKYTYMPCDAPAAVRIVLGEQSIIIIVVSLLCLLLLVLLILCLARRRQKSVSYPELDGIVKESIGATDLEGYGEKDIDQFDLKLLRVGPNGHLFNGEINRRLPDVTEDARATKAPLAKMPEGLSIGDFLDDYIKKVDKEPSEYDDVRHYCFEGDEMSIASLSSIGSGSSSDNENVFDTNDNWGPRFEKLKNIYHRDSDEEEDSEYDFNVPRQPKRYSLQSTPEKKSPTRDPAAESSSSADKNPSGPNAHSPTVTFADPGTQGSQEGLLPKDSQDTHEAINPMANFKLGESKESWC